MAPFTLRVLLSLVAGLAGGVSLDPSSSFHAHLAFAGGVMLAALAHANRWWRFRDAAACIAAGGAAWLLGMHALDEALRPPLRTLLEAHYGGFAIDSSDLEERGEPVRLEGILRQDAAPGSTGIVLRMNIDRVWIAGHAQRTRGGVSVVVSGEMAAAGMAAWTEGRRIRATTSLRRPARYLNDGVPDMERALARRGVTLVGSIKSGALVEVVAIGKPWDEWGARVRARVRRVLISYLSSGDAGAAAIAIAILIGDRAALDLDVERRLQEAGTYHVLAISGGNIAILAGVVLGLLALAGWRGPGAQLSAIATLGTYAVIVEGGPSVARATTMALLYLAVRLIDQRTAPVNALALVVIGILLVEPLAVVDVGLWLTCGATLGILLGASVDARPRSTMMRAVVALVMATIAAEIVLMPVSALVFQRVTLAGLALNFVAIPCMTIVQLGAMTVIGADAAGLTSVARLAAVTTEWGVWGLLQSGALVDVLPWLTWRVPPPRLWLVALYYAVVAVWWRTSRGLIDTVLQQRTVRTTRAAAIVLFVWIAVDPPSLARAHGDGRVHLSILDVGQGDAMLVTFPNGRHLLVDAGGVAVGGDFDVGERVVGPALRARGVRRLDYLAITHGDPDHLGGAAAIVRDFAPMEIWYGIDVANHAPAAALHDTATRQRTAWRTVRRGDRVEIGGATAHVLHPPPPDWERQKVRNNDSLVLDIRHNGVSLLLTGDIGVETEGEILPLLSTGLRTILKVPHHGSATSSSAPFLDAVMPSVATIGVGRGNPYGHPVPAILERYVTRGTQVFRTDTDGQIDVTTDRRSIEVRTFNGRQQEIKFNTKDTKDTKN